jgi:hypothetical protein
VLRRFCESLSRWSCSPCRSGAGDGGGTDAQRHRQGGGRPQTARAYWKPNQCANQGVEEVHLLLGTPAAGVDAGLTVYNVLKGMPFNLITHNTGNVASIGVAVYLAGEEAIDQQAPLVPPTWRQQSERRTSS